MLVKEGFRPTAVVLDPARKGCDENTLNAKKEQIYNLPYVEEYARDVLGMVKLDKSQVEYVELSNPEVMTVRQEAEYSSAFLSGLAKSFNVILEYLN